jgi:hypothetical protein
MNRNLDHSQSQIPPETADYTERALELADRILGDTSELRKLLLRQHKAAKITSARRGLTVLFGGGEGAAEYEKDVVEGFGVRIEKKPDGL